MPKPWKQRFEQPLESSHHPIEPAPVDSNEVALLAAELRPLPTLDLHGLSVADALCDLDIYIHHQITISTEAVRIIYGIGEGKLKTAILQWLDIQTKAHGLIAAYRPVAKPASVIV